MKHYVNIITLPHFITIHNTNTKITTKYDTHPNKNPSIILIGNQFEKEDVSVSIYQVHIRK